MVLTIVQSCYILTHLESGNKSLRLFLNKSQKNKVVNNRKRLLHKYFRFLTIIKENLKIH